MNQSTAQTPDRNVAPSEHLAICGATDVGVSRADNQDTFVIADLRSGDLSNPCSRKEIPLSGRGILLLVCDGMGGPPPETLQRGSLQRQSSGSWSVRARRWRSIQISP